MKMYEPDTNPVLYDTEAVLNGSIRPPFPEMMDNTKWSDYRACPKKFLKKDLLHRTSSLDNIHLIAGGAFAEGCDSFRKAYYNKDSLYKKDFDEALTSSVFSAIEHYGFDLEREKDPEWAMSPKSCARIVMALDSYWKHYNPKIDEIKQYMINGDAASETSLTFPLDVCHPVTGQPILWHGRFDAIVEYNSRLMALDDKTTTSLGATWPKQWPMRGQFMGYAYGARALGYDITGTVVRGTAILKGSINHMQVPVDHPTHLLNKWFDQVNSDVEKMIEDWKAGKWDYNFGDSCTAYGGCPFQDSCRSQFEYRAIEQMGIRIWKPEDPENSPSYDLAAIQKLRREHGFYKEEV